MRVNKLSGIVMRVTAVLICLVLFSAHLASGMFAKYTTGTSEQRTARVAKFGDNVDGVKMKGAQVIEQEPLSFDVDNGTYKFLVKNNSEVKFQYDIVVKIKATDPEGIFSSSEIAGAISDVKLSVKDVAYDGTYSESNNSYTFSVDDGYLNMLDPGMDSDVYTFTFTKSDLVKINDEAASPVTNTTIPIKFDVSAKGTQVN